MISKLRAVLRHLFVYALYLSGSMVRAKNRIRANGGTVVLTLHRVLPDTHRSSTLSPPGMVLSEQTFSQLVGYLSSEHQIVSLSDPLRATCSDSRILVAITFDDGWVDNARYAHPILVRHAAPATIFVCPSKMGQNLPFWPEKLTALFSAATRVGRKEDLFAAVAEHAIVPANVRLFELIDIVKKLPSDRRDRLLEGLEQMFFYQVPDGIDSTMTWETARQLAEEGVVFGSHTLHHEILTHIPTDQARAEITSSRERVQAEIGRPCFAFAYPNGNWSWQVREFAASAGYALAFANSPGIWCTQTDPFTIPRINIWEGAVTGFRGRFSRAHLEYLMFWRTVRGAAETKK